MGETIPAFILRDQFWSEDGICCNDKKDYVIKDKVLSVLRN